MEINTLAPLTVDSILSNNTSNEPEITAMKNPDPVAAADRIKTLDMIRGVALLGILMMNIPYFALDQNWFYDVIRLPHNNSDYITNRVVLTFFDGTMRGLFSMLFGAGMLLFTINKKEGLAGIPVAEFYYRRLLWLVAFGLFNAFVLLWPGDILFFYGLCGMLLYPFRKLRPVSLITIGILCMLIGIIRPMNNYDSVREVRHNYVLAIAAEKAHLKLTAKQQQDKTAWLEKEKKMAPDRDGIKDNVQKMRSGYGTVFTHLIPENASIETFGMYHGFWDMLSMMFVGMGLFGLGFFSNKLSTSTYVMALLVGYGIGIPVAFAFFNGAVERINIGHFLDTYSMPPDVLYDLRRLLLAIGHASLLILVVRLRLAPWLMKALANVGQMAFTNYLMQSIFCSLIFYGYGLNYFNALRFHQLYYIVAGIWIFQIIFSVAWLRYFRFGPFEWVWRSLTYWRRQPMRLDV